MTRCSRNVAVVLAGLGVALFARPAAVAAADGAWVPTGPMIDPPSCCAGSALLTDGEVLLAGGRIAVLQAWVGVASVQAYDPATRSWSSGAPLRYPRHAPTATTVPDGSVLVAGGAAQVFFSRRPMHDGFDEVFTLVSRAERYDPALRTWSDTAPMLMARIAHTATLLPTGMVLLAGGVTTTEGQDVWCEMPPVGARTGDTCPAGATAELYDPVTQGFFETSAMTRARSQHSATLLRDGRVLVIGGSPDATAEIYDPSTATWTLTAPMTAVRYGSTAALLADGTVLVAGGRDLEKRNVDTAEIFDPVMGTWSPTGSMTKSRGWPSAALLLNGMVLVAGGGTDGTAEIFDPTAGTWVPTAPMLQVHYQPTAIRLAHGNVLVVGNSDVAPELFEIPAAAAGSGCGGCDHGFGGAGSLLVLVVALASRWSSKFHALSRNRRGDHGAPAGSRSAVGV